MADRRDNAVATAQQYHQGNIAGLDDAMTRRLIASTVYTESNGGDLHITNRQGYTGRYQAGAGWLADAGYVDADKLHAAMDGYRSEWAWASKGHMTEFLNDPANWKNGLNLQQYKDSPELQDQAFKLNSDKAYRTAVHAGVLHADDDPAKIAGFLKARHIAGQGGATAAVTGGRVIRDSNGTSNYDYLHDITRNRDGLDQRMNITTPQRSGDSPAGPGHGTSADHALLKQGSTGSEVSQLQGQLAQLGYKGNHNQPLRRDGDFGDNTQHAVMAFQRDHHLTVDGKVGNDTRTAMASAVREHSAVLLDNPAHPGNALFREAKVAAYAFDHNMGRTPDLLTDQLAGSAAAAAQKAGLEHINRITISQDGSRVFAVQDGAIPKVAHVQTAEAVHMSLAQSSHAWDQQVANQPAAPNVPQHQAATPVHVAPTTVM